MAHSADLPPPVTYPSLHLFDYQHPYHNPYYSREAGEGDKVSAFLQLARGKDPYTRQNAKSHRIYSEPMPCSTEELGLNGKEQVQFYFILGRHPEKWLRCLPGGSIGSVLLHDLLRLHQGYPQILQRSKTSKLIWIWHHRSHSV